MAPISMQGYSKQEIAALVPMLMKGSPKSSCVEVDVDQQPTGKASVNPPSPTLVAKMCRTMRPETFAECVPALLQGEACESYAMKPETFAPWFKPSPLEYDADIVGVENAATLVLQTPCFDTCSDAKPAEFLTMRPEMFAKSMSGLMTADDEADKTATVCTMKPETFATWFKPTPMVSAKDAHLEIAEPPQIAPSSVDVEIERPVWPRPISMKPATFGAMVSALMDRASLPESTSSNSLAEQDEATYIIQKVGGDKLSAKRPRADTSQSLASTRCTSTMSMAIVESDDEEE